jgi:DedD protein
MPYDFSLDRKATITLSAGSVLLLILVFVAGVLTGLTWRSPAQEIMAQQKPAILPTSMQRPAAPTGAPPPQAVQPAAPSTPVPTSQSAMPSAPAPTAASSAAPASAAGAAAAAQPTAQASAAVEAPSVQLSIQVGAFIDKANADKLVERLKEAGYAPQIVLGGHPPRRWNFVRVGPYHDWSEASQIAAVISRDEDTEAVVRPMK